MRVLTTLGIALVALIGPEVVQAQMIPNEGPVVPHHSGAGSAPPVTCSNKLDFTQACNSQYLL
jgi:hypothetical protein